MKENSVKWFGYLFSFAFLIIACTGGTELTQKQDIIGGLLRKSSLHG
jgi:hypothetical protein